MSEQNLQKWFEEIWAHREERVYPDFFGDTGQKIHTLPAATCASMGWADPDPRFLTHGVFECPPNQARPHWLYVTSGMSNPWGDDPATANPAAPSGLGYEFTLHAPDRALWPIRALHWVMAMQLMVAAGAAEGELLQCNDRFALGGAIGKKEGELTHVLVASPESPGVSGASGENGLYPGGFALASGTVELLLLIGITARENDFVASQGVEGLITLLRHRGVFPLTDPGRVSVV